MVTMLIILYVILFEYTEGHHDLPLVTLFTATELDLCRHDPDGMSIDIDIHINIVAINCKDTIMTTKHPTFCLY